MNTRKYCVLSFVMAVAILLFGCAGSAFKQNYQSHLERHPSGAVSRLLPAEDEVRLLTSEDIRADAVRLMESGYLLLGRSKFVSEHIDPGSALKLAKEVGASVVLVSEQYVNTMEDIVPVTEWIPAREDKILQTVVITEGHNAGKVIRQTVVEKTEAEFQTTYVPQSTDYYEYAATFWAKLKPPVFGVIVRPTDEETRQRLQSNHGLIVEAVIRDSPAFLADILRGDVIMKFANQDISSRTQFFDLVQANANEKIELQIERSGELKTMSVQLATK